jgi:hypothetical protein
MDSILSESDSETDSDKILSINPPPRSGMGKIQIW